MARFAVILPAAGQSTRFKDRHKKPYVDLDGRAVWVRSAELFVNRTDVCQTILVISPDDREEFTRRFGANVAFMGIHVVEGGKTRTDSVAKGLEKLESEAEFVAIHDAARPCASKEEIDRVFAKAAASGAAILGTKIADTIKKATAEKTVSATVSRDSLWTVQTPQVFARDLILKAFANRARLSEPVTDDAQLVEAVGGAIALVEGSAGNIKITRKSDLMLAKAILKARPAPKPKQPLHPFADEKMW